MLQKDAKSFSSDRLPINEIEALKELERQNRDRGAAEYVPGLPFYDKSLFHLQSEEKIYLHYLSPKSGERMLDAGAGMGRLAIAVAPRVGRLKCVDLSAHSLQVLLSEAAARGIRNIDTVQSDLCGLPASLGLFDAVYSIEVFGSVPSQKERLTALRNLYRLLKPGGRCLVSVLHWNMRARRVGIEQEVFWGEDERRLFHHYFTSRELKELFHEAGFQDVRLRGLSLVPGKIIHRFPALSFILETGCSKIPAFAPLGLLLLAIGRRP